MILHMLIAMVAGWLQRHQQRVITYLLAENRVLKAPLDTRCTWRPKRGTRADPSPASQPAVSGGGGTAVPKGMLRAS